MVLKYKDGEKGVDLIAPFYTHIGPTGAPSGILVNRGWMPWDLRLHRLDKNNNSTVVTGSLYRGDNKTKYQKPNQPSYNLFKSTDPYQLAPLM